MEEKYEDYSPVEFMLVDSMKKSPYFDGPENVLLRYGRNGNKKWISKGNKLFKRRGQPGRGRFFKKNVSQFGGHW